jgi:pyruvate kinase
MAMHHAVPKRRCIDRDQARNPLAAKNGRVTTSAGTDPARAEGPPHDEQARIASLLAAVTALQRDIAEEALRRGAQIDAALPRHRASALNLAHYVGLRQKDLRRLQLELAAAGLSSLGRSEGHVADTLERLGRWLGAPPRARAGNEAPLDRDAAERMLHENTRALFGPRPRDRHVYVMVTAPDANEATADWCDAVLKAGADVLRINGAHESPAEWQRVIATARARAQSLRQTLRVVVDMPGPKLRGDIRRSEAGVLHLPRRKDRFGRTTGPTSVALVARRTGGAEIPVSAAWLARLRMGDTIELRDPAGRRRRLVVRERTPEGVRAECEQSLYVASGLPLVWRRARRVMGRGRVGAYPREPATLSLAVGARFLINATGRAVAGLPALGCPEPRILARVRAGERVILDDGKASAVVESVGRDGLRCRVLQAAKSPLRLRSGKGLAFPESRLPPGRLGAEDRAVLEFALAHADGVEVSFVNAPADVREVGERVRRSGRAGFGIILKLETREAIRNLPDILFEAMRYDPVGIMIARGDLAVELSFERLAEMQEELLWFGEACHLPVVWATQVLDVLAHTGVPTRAEVTDAAMSMRAECVMLNKGAHVAEAVKMLADIIRKMETHQYKKRSIYRPLGLALGARAGRVAS